MVLKDGKQQAFGDYDTIIQTGFDIEEILKSFNQQLQDTKDNKQFVKETNAADGPQQTSKSREEPSEEKVPQAKKEENLIVEEDVETGSMSLNDFKKMLAFSTGNIGFFLYFFFCFTTAFCQLYTTFWVSQWSV